MMGDDWKWAIGVTVTLITALIGAFRNLANRISANDKEINARVDAVKDNYVRRDDLDGHLARIDKRLEQLAEEMRENHRQILAALTARK